MGFYIPVSWLQAVHYYYFCTGIFSFAGGVMLSAYPSYAALFVVSYALNSVVCWYMSWWMHRKVKQSIILNYRRYFLNHIALAAASAGLMALLMYSVPMQNPAGAAHASFGLAIPSFMDAVIGFNFFAFFCALMWAGALRMDVLNRAFSTYNSMSLGRAKDFAMKIRQEMKTGTLVPADRFRSYKPGSDDKIDSILMEIWDDRKTLRKTAVMKLELAVCDFLVNEMLERAHSLGHSRNPTEEDVNMIANYQKLIEKYTRDSYEYEKRLNDEEARKP